MALPEGLRRGVVAARGDPRVPISRRGAERGTLTMVGGFAAVQGVRRHKRDGERNEARGASHGSHGAWDHGGVPGAVAAGAGGAVGGDGRRRLRVFRGQHG
ncbi:unnamed protein product [Cuscuta epithymum]|uniref:Uncharacterized protein n=1 Tax=Cuscuta epithymum TaxID=186058 RepID=A0AAV0FCX8_9ASTE|nr:unnamed protein product [Cuscuta epithymum]CAH9133306.1 unnamed protein product [Cuscuta epithymum]